jgi:hypothetical protein
MAEQKAFNVCVCPHTSTSPAVNVLLQTIEPDPQLTDQLNVRDPALSLSLLLILRLLV